MTTAGKTLERFNSEAIGAPAKPMTDIQIDGKFLTLATAAGLEGRADAWLRRIRAIESQAGCRALWRD